MHNSFANSSIPFPRAPRDKAHHPPARKQLLRSETVLGTVDNKKNCRIRCPSAKIRSVACCLRAAWRTHCPGRGPPHFVLASCCSRQLLPFLAVSMTSSSGFPEKGPWLLSRSPLSLQEEVKIFAIACCPKALKAFGKTCSIAKEIYYYFFLIQKLK